MPHKSKKTTRLPDIYRKVMLCFVVLTVILIGAIVFFSLVQATIEVTPRQALQSTEFLIGTGSGASEGIDTYLVEKSISSEAQVETTGTKTKTNQAVGSLIVTNTTNSPQPLVATTRFLTPEGILFRLRSGVTVPANGKVTAQIYPDKPLAKDVAPTRFTIPGLNEAKQKLIWGESQEVIGNSGQVVRIVSPDDLIKARVLILKTLEDNALKQLTTEVKDKFTSVAIVSKVLSSEISIPTKAYEEKQSFSVSGKVKFVLLAYEKSKLAEIAKTKLLLALPSDQELASFGETAMKVNLENYDLMGGKATLRVYADGETSLTKTSPILNVEKIAGMSLESAKRYLGSFEAIENVEISIFPMWLKNIPKLKDHINVIIKK